MARLTHHARTELVIDELVTTSALAEPDIDKDKMRNELLVSGVSKSTVNAVHRALGKIFFPRVRTVSIFSFDRWIQGATDIITKAKSQKKMRSLIKRHEAHLKQILAGLPDLNKYAIDADFESAFTAYESKSADGLTATGKIFYDALCERDETKEADEKEVDQLIEYIKSVWGKAGVKDRLTFHIALVDGTFQKKIKIDENLAGMIVGRSFSGSGATGKNVSNAVLWEVGDELYGELDVEFLKKSARATLAGHGVNSYGAVMKCGPDTVNGWLRKSAGAPDMFSLLYALNPDTIKARGSVELHLSRFADLLFNEKGSTGLAA